MRIAAPQAPAEPLRGITLAVVGVGLIGGSVAAALRQQGVAARVLGVESNPETLRQARALGLIDAAASVQEAAAQANVIVLAVPVGAMIEVLRAIGTSLRPQTLVTDVGSTKTDVVKAAEQALGERAAQFVPGHPIAGSEASGPQAAHAALFDQRTVVLTPMAQNPMALRQRVVHLWQAMGAHVVQMSPEAHDAVLASVSHLPHLLAAAYMAQVAASPDADLRLDLAGSSFRDVTRVAASSPRMWRDIFLANRQAVLAELHGLKALLTQAETLLEQGDGAALQAFLETAASARRLWGETHG